MEANQYRAKDMASVEKNKEYKKKDVQYPVDQECGGFLDES